jgi:hypothetical protein
MAAALVKPHGLHRSKSRLRNRVAPRDSAADPGDRLPDLAVLVPGVRDLDLPDLVAHTVDDARALVEAQVSSLKSDLGVRLGDLGTTIKSWLIAVCVAIVTTVLLGVALAATLTQVVGLPWWLSLWIVTAAAVGTVVGLVYRARAAGRRAEQNKQLLAQTS